MANLLLLRQNQRNEFLLAQRIKCLGSYPKLESAHESRVNPAATAIQNALGVSSYGDFELLETKSGFVVQNRQVSGAPTWPNASVNSAIAAQLGKTKVAVCLTPQKVVVDGKALPLRQGKVELLADGTQISLRGNSYLMRGASGDWVKADVNTGYIDVRVGLGRWPIDAQGLLVNVNSDPNQVAMREGTVLKIPFSFEEFYYRYGESWRVKPTESMLNVCGEPKELRATGQTLLCERS